MKPAPAIDLAHRLLHLLGWSVGEAGFKQPDGSRYWMVDAHERWASDHRHGRFAGDGVVGVLAAGTSRWYYPEVI
jgi:hypothetical protein